MSLYENINKRKKAGTSRSKKSSTVSDKSYAKMKAGFRSGGMANQMSEQMGVSKKEAGGLMKKAKKMNDGYDMNIGGLMGGEMRSPGMGGYEINRGHGGTVLMVSLGRMSPFHSQPEERAEDSSLIKSTENQVRARHFNNNDGKGTF